MTRRGAATLALGALLLGGCTSAGDSNYEQVWRVLRASVKASFGDSKVTRDQAAAVPYASMGWRLGKGPQSLIVLATDKNGQRLWTSAARIVLVTEDGRLTRSVGLPHDLGGLNPRDASALPAPAQALTAPFHSTRLADYPDMGRYGVTIDCQSRAMARQSITILGRALTATLVQEDCYAQALRWRFQDQYWVDPTDGTVWRSRQHIHPEDDVLETELFRPPG